MPFPADLLLCILTAVLSLMQERGVARQRACPAEIAWAQARYPRVRVADGSTLDALIRKVGLSCEAAAQLQAGRMMVLLDFGSRLPRHLWYTCDPGDHDQGRWPTSWPLYPTGPCPSFTWATPTFSGLAT